MDTFAGGESVVLSSIVATVDRLDFANDTDRNSSRKSIIDGNKDVGGFSSFTHGYIGGWCSGNPQVTSTCREN